MWSMELHSDEVAKPELFPQIYSSYKILRNNPLRRKHLLNSCKTYMLQFSEKHHTTTAFHSFRSNPDSVLEKLKVLLNVMIHSFPNRKIQQFSVETFIPSLNKWCLKFLFLF